MKNVLESIKNVAVTTTAIALSMCSVQFFVLLNHTDKLVVDTAQLSKHTLNSVAETFDTLNKYVPGTCKELSGMFDKLCEAVGKADQNKVDELITNMNSLAKSTDEFMKKTCKPAVDLVGTVHYMITAVQDGYVMADVDVMKVLGETISGVFKKSSSYSIGVRIIPRHIYFFITSNTRKNDPIVSYLKEQLYCFDFLVREHANQKNINDMQKKIIDGLKGYSVDTEFKDNLRDFLNDIKNMYGENRE